MKKLLLISLLIGAMPLAMMAQDDDLYFTSKKKKTSKVEEVTDKYGLPKDTYYVGSDRDVDEYNRRFKSSYEVIDSSAVTTDTLKSDVITDYELTKLMERFDDYRLADNEAFWRGYRAGRYDYWGWHSPWYYSWYDPWYYGWHGRYWYDPWYYSWYDPWYDPWYYRYGWGWGWGYPRWGGGYVSTHGNAGTIRRSHTDRYVGMSGRGYNSVSHNSARMSSLRERVGSSGRYSVDSSQRSSSGRFSGRRDGGSYSSSRSSGSYSGSRSSGGFSGGSRGGGFSGGGGGGGHRSGGMGGRR